MVELVHSSDLSRLVGDVYDCALDPSRWPSALKKIAMILNGRNAVLLAHNPTMRSAEFLFNWGENDEQLAIYVQKYAAINPLLTAGWHSEIDEPVSAENFIDYEQLRRTRFYKEFAAPVGWCDMVGATLQKSAHRYTTVSITRGQEAGRTGQRELDIMRLLAPHIRRAVTIYDALDAKGRKISDLRAALDLAPSAIFLLNDVGRCVQANRAAERLLSTEVVATLEHGQLLFADREVRAQVTSALAFAAKDGCARASSAVVRSSRGSSFAVELVPLVSDTRRVSGDAILALFMHEVGCLQPLPGEVLVKLYGLTPAETRLLVLLAQAMKLSEASEILGIREATARTHLRQIFAKTGTTRQAEAVRLVMSALPDLTS